MPFCIFCCLARIAADARCIYDMPGNGITPYEASNFKTIRGTFGSWNTGFQDAE